MGAVRFVAGEGERMEGFYWLVPGVLAGTSRPGARRWGAGEAELAADLAWLWERGIRGLVSLTEESLDPDALAEHAFNVIHIPVPDMTPPLPDQIGRALQFIDEQAVVGNAVAVHCLAGQGRTGTVLAAYLIRLGRSSERAIQELRLVCPRGVENALQERALAEYAAKKSWLV